MSGSKYVTRNNMSMSSDVDDAVGISKKYWFVAILNSRSEKITAEKLSKLGIENYLPIQKEIHVWKNGKKVKIDKVVIPSKIFIYCTELKRRELVKLPYIFRFMTNNAASSTNSGHKPLAIVPESEINQLKFILGVSGVRVSFTESFVKGQKVVVLRGPLKGLVGEIVRDPEKTRERLYINIGFLGCAFVEIDTLDLELIK